MKEGNEKLLYIVAKKTTLADLCSHLQLNITQNNSFYLCLCIYNMCACVCVCVMTFMIFVIEQIIINANSSIAYTVYKKTDSHIYFTTEDQF